LNAAPEGWRCGTTHIGVVRRQRVKEDEEEEKGGGQEEEVEEKEEKNCEISGFRLLTVHDFTLLGRYAVNVDSWLPHSQGLSSLRRMPGTGGCVT
jgi:hypothetical protein